MAGCGLFRGVPGGGAAGNHVITTDDSTFEYLGINTFTTGELWQVLQGHTADNKSLGGVLQTNDSMAAGTALGADGVLYYSILNADEVSEPTRIMKWDAKRKKYVTTIIDKDVNPYIDALSSTYTSDQQGNRWTIQKIIDLNDMLNNGALDFASAANTKAKRFLLDVKNSQSGCVTWSQVFKVRFTPDVMKSPASGACTRTSDGSQVSVSQANCLGPVYTWDNDFYPADIEPGCVKENRVHFRLYLYDNRNPRNNSRPVIGRGAPRMAMTPITPWGQQWSNSTYSQSTREPGVLPPPEQGGDGNPSNPAVGELDVTFNSNTGKMEAGNKQILARLLTIVPSVDITSVGDPESEDISALFDGLNQDSIFEVDSESYMGRFAVGYAMPMMVHNGNPYHFGPTWQNKKCDGNKKAKIRVVNRSSRTFAVGDVVMCTLIDNEWIIMDFGQSGPKTPVFEMGAWEFSKHIVDRDSYFRDHRHWSKNHKWSYDTPGWQFLYSDHMTPEGYESIYRTKYYLKILNSGPFKIAGKERLPEVTDPLKYMIAKNLGILANDFTATLPQVPDFEGSLRYWQTSSFDFMDKGIGGMRGSLGGPRGHIIGRTQYALKPDGKVDEADPQYAQVYAPFWGPYFNEGYTSDSIKNSRASQQYGFRRAGGYAGFSNSEYYLYEGNFTGSIFQNASKNVYGPIFGGVMATPPDVNVKQMPADIACLAPPKISDDVGGQNGGPMVVSRWITKYDMFGYASAGQGSRELTDLLLMVDTNNANMADRGVKRWLWLHSTTGPNMNNENRVYDAFYDWKPAGMKVVTFVPVTSDYICSWDETTKHIAPHHSDSFWNSSRSDIIGYQHKPTDLIPEAFWQRNGNVQEIGLRKASHLSENSHSPVFPYLSPINPPLNHAGTRGDYAIPYGGYVKNPGEYKNYSLRHWNFDTNCGGVHGITTARCSVRIKNAQLTFKTNYRLGMCNLIVNHTGGQMFFRKWGTGNQIHSKEATALHAKVCGAWPRSQTVFDARYFAVHHFNPGTSYTGGSPAMETTTLHENSVFPPTFPQAGSWVPGIPLPSFPRIVDTLEYSVDFRVPSWFLSKADPSTWDTVMEHSKIPTGTHINGAMQQGTDKKPLFYPLVAPSSEWDVDRIRRQMLLPFTYMKRTIGIDENSAVIEDGGREYKAGDILTVSGGSGHSAAIKVVSTDDAQGNGFGAITAINAYTLGPQEGAYGGTRSLGEDFMPQDFINPEIVDDNGVMIDSPKIYADDASGLGQGAVIHFKYGRVTWYWKTDKGPARNSMQRLTPNSGGSTDTHCGGLYNNEETVTTVNMDQQSEDGRYDVFLHFHNDISHNSAKDRGGVGEGFENHVSLTMNAT